MVRVHQYGIAVSWQRRRNGVSGVVVALLLCIVACNIGFLNAQGTVSTMGTYSQELVFEGLPGAPVVLSTRNAQIVADIMAEFLDDVTCIVVDQKIQNAEVSINDDDVDVTVVDSYEILVTFECLFPGSSSLEVAWWNFVSDNSGILENSINSAMGSAEVKNLIRIETKFNDGSTISPTNPPTLGPTASPTDSGPIVFEGFFEQLFIVQNTGDGSDDDEITGLSNNQLREMGDIIAQVTVFTNVTSACRVYRQTITSDLDEQDQFVIRVEYQCTFSTRDTRVADVAEAFPTFMNGDLDQATDDLSGLGIVDSLRVVTGDSSDVGEFTPFPSAPPTSAPTVSGELAVEAGFRQAIFVPEVNVNPDPYTREELATMGRVLGEMTSDVDFPSRYGLDITGQCTVRRSSRAVEPDEDVAIVDFFCQWTSATGAQGDLDGLSEVFLEHVNANLDQFVSDLNENNVGVASALRLTSEEIIPTMAPSVGPKDETGVFSQRCELSGNDRLLDDDELDIMMEIYERQTEEFLSKDEADEIETQCIAGDQTSVQGDNGRAIVIIKFSCEFRGMLTNADEIVEQFIDSVNTETEFILEEFEDEDLPIRSMEDLRLISDSSVEENLPVEEETETNVTAVQDNDEDVDLDVEDDEEAELDLEKEEDSDDEEIGSEDNDEEKLELEVDDEEDDQENDEEQEPDFEVKDDDSNDETDEGGIEKEAEMENDGESSSPSLDTEVDRSNTNDDANDDMSQTVSSVDGATAQPPSSVSGQANNDNEDNQSSPTVTVTLPPDVTITTSIEEATGGEISSMGVSTWGTTYVNVIAIVVVCVTTILVV